MTHLYVYPKTQRIPNFSTTFLPLFLFILLFSYWHFRISENFPSVHTSYHFYCSLFLFLLLWLWNSLSQKGICNCLFNCVIVKLFECLPVSLIHCCMHDRLFLHVFFSFFSFFFFFNINEVKWTSEVLGNVQREQ